MKQKNSSGTRRMFFANTLLSLLAYGLLEALTIGLENFLDDSSLFSSHTARMTAGAIAFIYAGVLIGIIVYYSKVILHRLDNIGWSKWWFLFLLIPLANIPFFLFLFTIPANFSWTQFAKKTKSHIAQQKIKIALILWLAGVCVITFIDAGYYCDSDFFIPVFWWGIMPVGIIWSLPIFIRKCATTYNKQHKLCPYCAEKIKLSAIKCKHCQSDLANDSAQA